MNEQPDGGRRKDRIKLVGLVALGLLLLAGGGVSLVFLTGLQSSPASTEKTWVSVVPVKADYPAPELNLTDMNGNPVSLSGLAGQVVLVNNWAFWCPPCRAELPELEAYYEAHRQQGFTVIGIEAGDEKDDVDYHIKLFKLTYPIWLDPETDSLYAFDNKSLPNSYVIDKTGKVRLSWVGVIDRTTLENYVTPLLEE